MILLNIFVCFWNIKEFITCTSTVIIFKKVLTYFIFVYLKSGLIRSMASLEGDNLVVFYYLSVSENWPDKRDGLSGGGQSRPSLLSDQFSDTLR
jgi:hypothetical protein